MTRGVDEGELVTVTFHRVGADVLGDATRLAGHDVGVTNTVEHRGLAVVDVAHHGDHRWPRLEQFLVLVVTVVEQGLKLNFFLLARIDQQQIGPEVECVQLHVLVGQAHRDGEHFAVLQQELDDVAGGAVELGTELLSRDTPLDDDRAIGHGRIVSGVRLLLGLQLVTIATTTTLAASRWSPLTARPTAARATGPTAWGATGGTAGTATRATCIATAAGATARASRVATGAATGATRRARSGRASAAGRRRNRLAG